MKPAISHLPPSPHAATATTNNKAGYLAFFLSFSNFPDQNVYHLTLRNIKPNRTGIIILEVIQARITTRLQLKANRRSSRTREGSNTIRIARRYSLDTIISLHAWSIGEGGGLCSNAIQEREVDTAVTAEGEGAGLELGLGWEEED